MIGFYVYNYKDQNIQNLKASRFFSGTDYHIIAGGCCMGIDSFSKNAGFSTVDILIPHTSEDIGSITVTLEEVQRWTELICKIGINCEITNPEFIYTVDYRTNGYYYVVTFDTIDSNTFCKYNLLVLSLFRYMFNGRYLYRKIYEATIELLNLLPEEDFITLLHLAHILFIGNRLNNTRGGSSIEYTQYYSLFPDVYSKLLNSKELLKRINSGKFNSVNGLCTTRGYNYDVSLIKTALKQKDVEALKTVIKNSKI